MTDVSAAIIRERKYVGGWELYRQIDPTTSTITLPRETLHVMDGQARVAIIDTNATESLVRYQYTNHLGTATLEVDDATNVITYEEYYPYGNTAFTTTQNVITTKRYRYIGKERDDESGFYYMGARYYCPWLARWLAPDPINSEWYNMTHGNPDRNKERHFLEMTASGYEYCYANPIRFTDPGGEQAIPPEWTESGAAAQARPAQDNLAPQGKPIMANDHIPTTQLEKGQMAWRDGHPGVHTISAPKAATVSESSLQKMTPQERYLHEQVRVQKLELAGYKPNGEPTGATKLARNKHWQGLANNIVFPTLEAASVVDGVGLIKNTIFKEAGNAGINVVFGKTGIENFIASANNPAKQQGLTEVGRALQKHVGREGSVFEGLEFSHKTANQVGLNVLDDILKSETQLIRPAKQGGHEIFDLTTGRGVGVSRGGLFNGFREFSK